MASRSDGSFKNAIVEEKSNNDDAKGEITIRKVYYEGKRHTPLCGLFIHVPVCSFVLIPGSINT